MSMIKGITVQLKKKIQTGTDAFGNPIYDYQIVNVDNVLIGEPSADDVTSEMSLYGKKLAYTLAIPKGDTNIWEDTEVSFFGANFRTYGYVTQGIELMIPLDWNKKVKVERYG